MEIILTIINLVFFRTVLIKKKFQSEKSNDILIILLIIEKHYNFKVVYDVFQLSHSKTTPGFCSDRPLFNLEFLEFWYIFPVRTENSKSKLNDKFDFLIKIV